MTSPLMNVYARAPLAFVKGEGAWLQSSEGGEPYLDCVAGVASNALGHCHPALVAALIEQGNKLWHVSNMFEVPGQDQLAARLTGASFADTVFFANTGTEAVECAIKVARRYHAARGAPQRQTIIGFHGAFHGRTYAALNAAGNAAHLDGFGAPMAGFVHLSPDDWAALAAAIADPAAAAVLIEPVQGEGGARAMTRGFLESLRAAISSGKGSRRRPTTARVRLLPLGRRFPSGRGSRRTRALPSCSVMPRCSASASRCSPKRSRAKRASPCGRRRQRSPR